ncbi:RnfH family protein [Hydrogenophaga sp. PAMC20947]|uniref:RnfH family protein n=1 Tax=Hydrogenophaga sp. PAMC20947 TaxID=2565558 RepID=UPI00109DC1CF|nr:RnfH family protein [Hydrogenophaga sp. PAMC20947]QCB45515.1 RnfH family protein [Hydrogenophaga sp. PAMC20947]
MKVILMYAIAPRLVHEQSIEVAEGSTVQQAVDAGGWWRRFPALAESDVRWGIWSRLVELDAALREGDRVEAYRPLRVDPKVARRERFTGQGAKGAGLFSKRRPGSKAGY